MKRINLLDSNTANKIAAGEVVERPSSVVKELVENSIDAGAKNITIEITEGGCNLIKIVDDGVGIHPDDIKKAFLPHATSKIKDVEDIFSINTLGFRGEALASIASVSKVNLKTKTDSCEFGREIYIEGGEVLKENDCGTNTGTIIEVRDLFYNVPARKKFLKSATREGSIITDIINRISISHPDISFKLFNNGKKLINTFGNGNIKDVLRAIYGKKISDNLISFEDDKDFVSVNGFIGKEEIARGSRNNQSIFVNGRYIKNKTLVAAVENAFKSFSTVNKFPFFVLFINIYPEYVDVNIHPTKAEIKFKDERFIFKVVFDAVHSALKKDVFDEFKLPEEMIEPSKKLEDIQMNMDLSYDNSVKFNSFEKNEKLDNEPKSYVEAIDREKDKLNELKEKIINKDISINKNTEAKDFKYDSISNDKDYAYNINESTSNNVSDTSFEVLYEKSDDIDIKDDIKYTEEVKTLEKERIAKFPPLKIIGQFNKTYIIGEFNETLYLIDQHAAHEKILFEKYMDSIKNSSIVVQPLLVPNIIELTVDELAFYEENSQVFKDAGFKIDYFGGNTLALKEVPYFLGKLDSKALFLSIIDDLRNLGTGKTVDVKYNKIATIACKAAIKANDSLNEREMIKLVEDLRFIEDPFHCPHGRPTIIKFTSYELEKKFRRIV